MRNLISATISLVVVPGLLAGALPLVDVAGTADPVTAEPATELVSELVVLVTTDDERQTVARSVGLFEQAGLRLPPLVVRVGSPGGCSGRVAVHLHRDGISEIELCETGTTGLEHILLHELGHAWVALNLDDEARQRFQEERGWEHWNHHSDDWNDRGTEQAAEVIKWGVNDRVAPILIEHDGCDDLATSYRILTGVDPIQPRTVACERRVATAAW